MTKRVLVVGPGALGIIFAVRLADAGHDVRVAVRSAKSAVPEELTAIGVDGTESRRRVPQVHRKGACKDIDLLVLATKLDDALPALQKWHGSLADGGAVVTLQNGILDEGLVELAGDRLVACTVGFPATLEAPGVSRQTGPGEVVMGAWPDGRMEPATPLEVAEVLQAVVPARIHRNMIGVQWNKLAVNAAITGLGAMTGATLGEILAQPRARDAVIDIFTEARAAGRAEGVRFEAVSGLHVDRIAYDRSGRVGRALRHGVLRIVGRKYRDHRSSSLQSLERGRPTEVARLNGHIADVAKTHGLAAPVNQAITDQVHRIESGEVEPDIRLLETIPVRFH